MRKITRIFVHCTAGSQKQTVEDLKAEFKRKGWKAPGYHYVVDAQGQVCQLLSVEQIANGVYGYNKNSIHIAYMGGVDANGKAADNRTPEQKKALREIVESVHKHYPDAAVLGHRDISPDKNGNGIVDPWERIKECPSFDVATEL